MSSPAPHALLLLCDAPGCQVPAGCSGIALTASSLTLFCRWYIELSGMVQGYDAVQTQVLRAAWLTKPWACRKGECLASRFLCCVYRPCTTGNFSSILADSIFSRSVTWARWPVCSGWRRHRRACSRLSGTVRTVVYIVPCCGSICRPRLSGRFQSRLLRPGQYDISNYNYEWGSRCLSGARGLVMVDFQALSSLVLIGGYGTRRVISDYESGHK